MRLKQIIPSRQWWSSLLVNFLGALLGIIVTFGSSSWIEYKNKQAMTYKFKVLTLDDIDNAVNNMETIYKQVQHLDSIFEIVDRAYPDSLNLISEDILNDFLSCILYQSMGELQEKSIENVFSQSIEIWTDFDDPRLQDIINHFYAMRKSFYIPYNEFLQKKEDALYHLLEKKKFSEYLNRKDDIYKGLRNMMKIPRFEYFIGLECKIYRIRMDFWLRALKQVRDFAYRQANITKEDIDKVLQVDEKFEFQYSDSVKL